MKISYLQTLRSNAGFYVGREYFDENANAWLPWSRESDYFKTGEEADDLLFRKFNDKDYELVSNTNGTYTLYLVWVHPELNITDVLNVIATYEDKSTAYLYYHADAALYFHEHGYNKYYDPQELFLK